MSQDVTRRDFVRAGAAVSGLVLSIHFPTLRRTGTAAAVRSTAALSPSALLQVTSEGVITLWLTKSEMGQGIHTALAMIVAEELEVPLPAVRMEQASADPKFGEQYTWASTSLSDMWQPLRKAGAQAREMLLGAASRAWGVPQSECVAEDGVIAHPPSGRQLPYGALVAVASALQVPENPPLKDPKAFRILGRPTHRLDTPAKVDGSARYGIDVRLPGMLFACVARCPVFGRALTGYDEAQARAIPGVRYVIALKADELLIDGFWLHRIPSVVAVVADNSWAAIQGCRALQCRWEAGGGLDSEGLSQIFRDRALQAGILGRNDGDAGIALEQAATRFKAVYEVPFMAHATMEPMNCTADVRAGRCDVYAPTQYPTGVQQVAERLTGMPPESVTVHTTLLGGGFGRRSEMHWVIDAIRTSQAISRPVQVVWTREDDLQHDNYRPASYHVLQAGLDGMGKITAWTHRLVAPSVVNWHAPAVLRTRPGQAAEEALDGAADLAYSIPNIRVDYSPVSTPVPLGWWRSVYASQNCFANETFLDEIARATRRDPFELRRELLANAPRHRRVLELAAQKSGWGTPAAKDRFRGIAVHKLFSDSVVAEVAEVSVVSGKVRVHRVVCAVDCGRVINPDTVKAQIEGSVVYGLSAALKGAITIQGGRVEQSNFHDYPQLRMDEMPEVEVHLVMSTDSPHGAGEPAVPPIAPAVANAVALATGRNVRRLPIAVGV